MPRWNDIPPWPGYTLASLAAVHHDIAVRCGACGKHGKPIRPDDLIPRFGPDFWLRDLVKYLVCAGCGERSAEIQIAVRHEMTYSRLLRDD